MEIKLFENENIKDIYALWNECFGDDKETIDLFLKNSFQKENTVIALDNNKIIAQMFLLPEEIYIEGKPHSAYYLYALGTSKEYRKRGIMGTMLEFAEALAEKRNIDYLFLVPASQRLFNYYGKFGYEKSFKTERVILTKAQILHLRDSEIISKKPFNADEFCNCRKRNLQKRNFVNWRKNELSLEYGFLGEEGEAVWEDNISFFISHKENKDVIYDLCAQNYNIKRITGAIINFLKSVTAEIYFPTNSGVESIVTEEFFVGMIKKLKPQLKLPEDIFIGVNLG